MHDITAIKNHDIILASQSPRRQHLLKELGINFTVRIKEVPELYPDHLKEEAIAVYLAKLKAEAFLSELNERELLITADTIVWVNEQVLGKPTDYKDAFRMLKLLSGTMHTVYTGVCLITKQKEKTFWASTQVYFRQLGDHEIEYYLNSHQPYDKAGAYGIQEWIGYVGVERINGSYFNVMGLPIQKLYDELKKF
ncbi:MAG: Maf-like protein [Salinivirgaceae bacterium]